MRDGAWVDARRGAGTDAAQDIDELGQLGEDAESFADAYAAASCTRRSPLLLRPARNGARSRVATRGALVALVIIAMLASLLAPGLAATQQLRRDAPRLQALNDSTKRWDPTLRVLNATSTSLDAISAYVSNRTSMTALLGALAEALPDSSAIVSLRVDSIAASMTVLSTAAASVIPELTDIQSINDARIFGSVTRESVGEAQVQRMTVRFRLGRGAQR